MELSGRRRQDARARDVKMYEVPQTGPWRPAVGAPLERLVEPRSQQWSRECCRHGDASSDQGERRTRSLGSRAQEGGLRVFVAAGGADEKYSVVQSTLARKSPRTA